MGVGEKWNLCTFLFIDTFLSGSICPIISKSLPSTVYKLACPLSLIVTVSDPSIFDGLRELSLLSYDARYGPLWLPSSLRVLELRTSDVIPLSEALEMFMHRPKIIHSKGKELIPEYNPPQLIRIDGLHVKDTFQGLNGDSPLQLFRALPQSLRSLSMKLSSEDDIISMFDLAVPIVDMIGLFPSMTDLRLVVVQLNWCNGSISMPLLQFTNFPRTLKRLECTVRVFDPSQVSTCLERLDLHCTKVVCSPFPTSLRYFRVKAAKIKWSQLPPGLVTLECDYSGDEGASFVDIPRSLCVLRLTIDTCPPGFTLSDLPRTLRKLYISTRCNLDFTKLPIGLKELKLDIRRNVPVSKLPSTIEKLTLLMHGNIEIAPLPSILQTLKIKNANDIKCAIELPLGLKSLKLGSKFDGYLASVPSSLEELEILNYEYSHKLPMLPETLRTLEFSALSFVTVHSKTAVGRKRGLNKILTNIPASIDCPSCLKSTPSLWAFYQSRPQVQQHAPGNKKILKRKRNNE